MLVANLTWKAVHGDANDLAEKKQELAMGMKTSSHVRLHTSQVENLSGRLWMEMLGFNTVCDNFESSSSN